MRKTNVKTPGKSLVKPSVYWILGAPDKCALLREFGFSADSNDGCIFGTNFLGWQEAFP